jgi:hypothetical protein
MTKLRRVPDRVLHNFNVRREGAHRATVVGQANVKSRGNGALGETDGEDGDGLQRRDQIIITCFVVRIVDHRSEQHCNHSMSWQYVRVSV